jgi:hypothetical protein
VVTASSDETARVWATPISDDRDSDDWIRLAQMLSGQKIDLGGQLVAISPQEFRDTWRALRKKYPDDFVASPGPSRRDTVARPTNAGPPRPVVDGDQ